MSALTAPDSLRRWLGSSPLPGLLLYAGLALLLLLLLFVLWLRFGRGPRRRRLHKRVRQLIHQREWQEALTGVQTLRRLGRLSTAWQGRARNAEGEAHRVAGDLALEERRYEESREHYITSARLLGLDGAEAHDQVLAAMLEEVRRLFATTVGPDTEPVHKLLGRLLALDASCAEALFWQGLCHVRDGHLDEALTALQAAREGVGNRVLEPSLYLGALQLRQGRPQEAIRYLADANRHYADCPFVTWQLGLAMVAKDAQAAALSAETKSELNLGVRALQRAVGTKGLGQWLRTPQRAWTEGLPDAARSFARRLVANYPFTCPVLGNDVAAMVGQGQIALAQAHYRTGNFQEAANLYATVLRESAPSVPVLRGLGLALTRLGQYDQAFIHLRTAHEREEPKSHLTAGYLAVCAARGKPARPEDKANNIAWAIGLLASFPVPADAEWAAIYSSVFAEARAAGVPVTAADQVRLCNVLAAVDATNPAAAAAYDHLAATFPEVVRSEYAWLYCRAAQQHGTRGERDLELFDRTFREQPAARAFYEARGWDIEEIEYTYLERCAAGQPGRFPETLGPEYPARGEALLLARSRQQEDAGQKDAALATAEVLYRLAPRSPAAHNHLADLVYHRGDLERACTLLTGWQALALHDYRPLVRRAVIEQERGQPAACNTAIDRALELTQGPVRAEVAFLGTRLALRAGPGTPSYDRALLLLHECLREDPNRLRALSCLAMVRAVTGDEAGLARQAAVMHRPDVKDPRFHFLAAVCHLAARHYPPVAEAATRAAADDASLAVESAYLMGWSFWHQENLTASGLALQKVANAPASPSAEHAKALLGRIGFARGVYDDAIRWWKALDAEKRTAWKFDEALRGAVWLSALAAFQAGQFDQAAERLREARRLGHRDPRLGALLTLALVKAGQQHLYRNGAIPTGAAGEPPTAPAGLKDTQVPKGKQAEAADYGPADTARFETAARLLDQALQAGCKDPAVIYLLAMAHKRRGNVREARNALRRIEPADGNVWLQLGVLSRREVKGSMTQPLQQAEQEFARAWQEDPTSYAACHNLVLTRLSLGQVEAAASLLPRLMQLAPAAHEQRRLSLLQALLPGPAAANGDGSSNPLLAELPIADEQQLLKLARGLGHLDTVAGLLRALASARPASAAVQEAYLEALLVKAKALLDRYDWTAADKLLAPFARVKWASRPAQTALLNLLGCCACLAQDFDAGVQHFAAALRLSGNDARIHQNLALAHEWKRQLAQADPHWNRFFELLSNRLPVPAGWPDYVERLAYEGLNRVATCYTEKERWGDALIYVERAHQVRPDEADTLERLFHLYLQVNRPQDAREALRKLRELRPNEPQHDLYELNLMKVKTLDDLERKLTELDRILKKYPNDPRVQDKAVEEAGNVIGLMGNLYDQLTEQLSRVVNQVRHLPNSQINWSAVSEVMRDMRAEFQKLRRITAKCMLLAVTEEQRRIIREVSGRIDRKIEVCRSWGG
jgi:tetratricopeptide (TPR) repeat protein